MKFTFKDLGPIKQADLTLGDLTIVCGKNNTGKTYVTYATYGFLDYWHNIFSIDISNDLVRQVMHKGSVSVPVDDFARDHIKILEQASAEYSSHVGKNFAGNDRLFDQTQIEFFADRHNQYQKNDVSSRRGSADKSFLEVNKSENETDINISLLVNKDSDDFPHRYFIEKMISNAIKQIVYKDQIPRPFIASAERTGSAIFQKELDFTRNRLVDLIGDKDSRVSPYHLLGRFSAEYPLPVRKNVDFIRDLPNIINRESIFVQKHPEVLERFADVIGGEYKVTKEGEIQYIPSKKKSLRLSMKESSSSVRSLLDIGFYLKHIAQAGDLLFVDEPELNLHPENQRRVARLFAMLANCGIRVFITTHSDYIIKEFNTLLMLNDDNDERLKSIAKRAKYVEKELLSSEQVKVYVTEERLMLPEGQSRRSKHQTLTEVPVDNEHGIAVESFDKTIEDMNRIQEEIFWGD